MIHSMSSHLLDIYALFEILAHNISSRLHGRDSVNGISYLLLAFLVHQCSASIKKWLPNTNFNNPANWDKRRVPFDGEDVKLDKVLNVLVNSMHFSHTYFNFFQLYLNVKSYFILVWKRVYTLPILVWNLVWFWRELRSVRMYLSFQFQMSKLRRKEKYANSKWIGIIFWFVL